MTTFYVSPSGSNTNGLSWSTAWTDTTNIVWANVSSGDTIIIDGGTSRCQVSPYGFQGGPYEPGVTCGQKYSAFTVSKDGVTIVRSTEAGRNGTVVIDGGRDLPLPYATQSSYSAPAGATQGIDLSGRSNVVIDGMHRSGIIVRGSQTGIMLTTGSNNIFRNMELFDNGIPTQPSTWGFNSDLPNVRLSGAGHTFDRCLLHDGGQDNFISGNTAQTGLVVKNCWMGSMRAHPTYPYEPFNDLQGTGADPGTTHCDGIQIYSPSGAQSGLTFDYCMFGPGTNQGLYPSETGTTWWNNVTVTNCLFTTVSHNIITSDPVTGWTVDHCTFHAPQGGFEIPNSGTNTMTNVIKFGGYVVSTGGTWITSNNVYFNGDPLPGSPTNSNPNFVRVPSGGNPSLTDLRHADFTSRSFPTNGSPIHSLQDLLNRIDLLNGGFGTEPQVFLPHVMGPR